MNIRFKDKAVNIRLNGEWQTIDPSKADVSYDLALDIGSATGSKEMMAQQLMTALTQISKITMPLQI